MNSPVSLTPLKRAQLDFWTGFRDYARKHECRISPTAPQPDTSMLIAIGRTGFGLCGVASTRSWDGSKYGVASGIRAEFLILDGKQIFDRLRKEQHRIQGHFPEERLIWFSEVGVKQCKVFVQKGMDWQDPKKRRECYEWLVRNLDRLHEVLAPLVKGPGIWDYMKLAWQRIKGCSWKKDV